MVKDAAEKKKKMPDKKMLAKIMMNERCWQIMKRCLPKSCQSKDASRKDADQKMQAQRCRPKNCCSKTCRPIRCWPKYVGQKMLTKNIAGIKDTGQTILVKKKDVSQKEAIQKDVEQKKMLTQNMQAKKQKMPAKKEKDIS